jgi:hypothetical protein
MKYGGSAVRFRLDFSFFFLKIQIFLGRAPKKTY